MGGGAGGGMGAMSGWHGRRRLGGMGIGGLMKAANAPIRRLADRRNRRGTGDP